MLSMFLCPSRCSGKKTDRNASISFSVHKLEQENHELESKQSVSFRTDSRIIFIKPQVQNFKLTKFSRANLGISHQTD